MIGSDDLARDIGPYRVVVAGRERFVVDPGTYTRFSAVPGERPITIIDRRQSRLNDLEVRVQGTPGVTYYVLVYQV